MLLIGHPQPGLWRGWMAPQLLSWLTIEQLVADIAYLNRKHLALQPQDLSRYAECLTHTSPVTMHWDHTRGAPLVNSQSFHTYYVLPNRIVLICDVMPETSRGKKKLQLVPHVSVMSLRGCKGADCTRWCTQQGQMTPLLVKNLLHFLIFEQDHHVIYKLMCGFM